ncbi:ATP-binding cassette domain-containing protein, partial [Blautia hydrogenotrophica]|uniref:ATP-binding cassette domain-containing protein n=1 Tax=Blautia hydrogenotrophica TaxID=53443 RepID=UPI003A8414C7
MGVLIESPPIYSHLTARENLLVRTTALGLPKARIEEALEIAGLPDTGKKKAGQFSMGMKQRLGIAQALLNRPKILVLDEPTAGLDPKERVRFRRLLERLGKESIVLLSTHIVSDLERIADRILLMQDGRLTFDGPLESVGEQLEEFYLEKFGEDDL